MIEGLLSFLGALLGGILFFLLGGGLFFLLVPLRSFPFETQQPLPWLVFMVLAGFFFVFLPLLGSRLGYKITRKIFNS